LIYRDFLFSWQGFSAGRKGKREGAKKRSAQLTPQTNRNNDGCAGGCVVGFWRHCSSSRKGLTAISTSSEIGWLPNKKSLRVFARRPHACGMPSSEAIPCRDGSQQRPAPLHQAIEFTEV
jgi:hypothetical protein